MRAASATGLSETHVANPLGFAAVIADTTGLPSPLSISSPSAGFTQVTLHEPDIVVGQHTVEFETYQSFSLPGEPSVMGESDPMVPQVARFYRIPNTGGVSLEVTPGDFELVDNVNPLPVKFEDQSFSAIRKSGVYDQDQWYPPVVAEMSDPMVMRDMRIVRVVLYPVQVNPVTHQARIYHNISVNIVASSGPGENEITHPRTISADWLPLYRHMISNLDEDALTDVTATPGSILIVTNSSTAVRPWADSLATWKKRKGYDVTVDARASWTASTVRSAILTAYQTWDPPLEYVVLMGDPGWTYGVPIYSGAEFDHAYASLTAGDEIEDIGVGRLSGNSSAVLAVINAKIMMYEREPHMQTGGGAVDTTWFHKAFLYAGVARQSAGNYLLMRWGQDQFVRNTGVNNVTVLTHPTDAVVTSDVTTQIDGGVSFFLWRGTWVGGMPTNMADLTAPAARLPITMTVTCSAGDYAGNGISGPAEGFLCYGTTANPKGGVCGLGTSTIGTSNGANVVLAGGLIYNIADAKVEHLGTAVAGAKAMLYAAYGPTFPDPDPYVNPGAPIALNFTRYFNLLGDPSLSMWTDVPKALTVTHPATASVGTHSMSLDVTETATGLPVADAMVVLWKGTETYERHLTDANGHVQMPLSILSTGNLLVTVTKRAYKPYLATVTCSAAARYVALSSYTLDDDNNGNSSGNGDHRLNPGETIELPLYLRNFGTSTTATNISASLTSNNARVTVLSGTSTFPNLAPSDSAVAATTYRFSISSQMQNDEEVLLTLTATASAVQTISTIALSAWAGEPIYVSHQFSGTVTPGSTNNLQVTLQNRGSVTLANAVGQLVSLSPYIQVTDGQGTYGNILAAQQVANSGDLFTLSSSALTYPGMQAPLRIILTTSNGYEDTVQFNASIGSAATTDPTGPDSYGYYAYDNTDVNYPHPTYSYVNISTGGGTNLNLSDPGDKTTPTPIYSAWVHLPFGFKFYGQVYDTLTVCSNGWCAFGNQSYIDMFRNYAIPSMGAPNAMIAPYWDDLKTNGAGQGVWYMNDAANHRFIVQWKAGAGSSYATALDFEVVLYDTTFTPTPSGNGRVEVQYNTVVMNLSNYSSDEPNGSTVGIQAPGNTVGLSYAYGASYAPGAAIPQTGRAIRFTTEGPQSPNPAIAVITPNGGENWFVGLPYNISWSSYSISGNVNITLNRTYPAGAWESLFSNSPNDGVQQWIPTAVNSTAAARIRIIGATQSTVGDTSNANFSLQIPTVNLTAPNGGEIFLIGASTAVTWSSNPTLPMIVSLNRSYPGGAWEVLDSAAISGLEWAVQGPATSTARIRAILAAIPTFGDTSAANFTIGVPPAIAHDPHADQMPGTALFVANVTDDVPGFASKLFYRMVSAGFYDSVTFTSTANPDEFSATTPSLAANRYEYYLRSTDTQNLSTFYPATGTFKFDVGILGANWLGCDDGTAEGYNWVNGPGFKWAVKFTPSAYPFALSGGRFAVSPSHPTPQHDRVVFTVYLADGPGGLPGTVVFSDTTGSPGNIIGGLPTGAAWAYVVTRVAGSSLTLNAPFYLCVENNSPRYYPVSFGRDSSSARCHTSYYYDQCELAWFNEDDAGNPNGRPGNRMIRAIGFALTPPTVVIYRTTNDVTLRWAATGAPYYKVFAATIPTGPFDTIIGTVTTNTFIDLNAVNLNVKRFYRVVASDGP